MNELRKQSDEDKENRKFHLDIDNNLNGCCSHGAEKKIEFRLSASMVTVMKHATTSNTHTRTQSEKNVYKSNKKRQPSEVLKIKTINNRWINFRCCFTSI